MLQTIQNQRLKLTLPDERYRAIRNTRLFLQDLVIPGKIPRVPKSVREQARSLLRHYPTDFDLWRACEAAPEVFQEKMEPLYRMVKKYEEDDQ